MMKLDLTPWRPTFVSGTAIGIKLTIRNTGPNRVRLQDATSAASNAYLFEIRTPGAEMPGVAHGPLPGTAHVTIGHIEIDPGNEWSGSVDLGRYYSFIEPGQYGIRVHLRQPGQPPVSSPEALIQIEKLRLVDSSVGLFGHSWNSRLVAAWMHQSEGGGQVFQRTFAEVDEQDREMEVSSAMVRGLFKGTGARALTQMAARDFEADYFHWILWQANGKLAAMPSYHGEQEEPLSLALPAGLGPILSPTLIDDDHTLDAIAILRDGNQKERLAALRFPDPMRAPGADPQVVDVADLPLPPHGAAATIDASNRRHVAFLAVNKDRIECFRVIFGVGKEKRQFDRAGLTSTSNARILSDSPLGVWVRRDGPLLAGVVLGSPKAANRCLLAEAVLGTTAESSVSEFELPDAPIAARVAYFQVYGTSSGPVRRVAAVWCADGSVCALEKGNVRIARKSFRREHPRHLVAMPRRNYLLEFDPARGPLLNEF